MRSIAVLLVCVACGVVFVAMAETGSDPRVGGQVAADVMAGQVPAPTAEVPDLARGTDMLARRPSAFIENQGQWEGAFSHLARFGPMTVFLEDRGWSFTLTEHKARPGDPGDPSADRGTPASEPSRGVAVGMRFGNGAGAATPIPEQRLAGVHNYFLGDAPERWRSNVPLHGSVRMAGLYPGIDVRTRGKDGHFEYDLLVEPGADLSRVEVEVAGADGLHLAADGTLIMDTVLGPVRQPVPRTWQVTAGGEREEVPCHYVVLDNTRFGFAAPGWDGDHALVVDPGLIWSTFLGGSSGDSALALTLDVSGAVVVAGRTASSGFPVTPGGYNTAINGVGSSDVFVTCLDPNGCCLLWSTFLGGTADDAARALALDASGVVTVTGDTSSPNFPTTAGAYDTTLNSTGSGSGSDAFVTRLDATGSSLLWSTYLGGSSNDVPRGVALDASGAVTVAGGTGSSDFPTTSGAHDPTYNGGGRDAFVARLDATGSSLVWSTFLGGTLNDRVFGVALDASGAATVAGETWSSDFPTTLGAYDTTQNGNLRDAFVTRLDATGGSLLWSTFLGGIYDDYATALALDASGAVTVTGSTDSSNFPTTPGAYDTSHTGGTVFDVFVARLDATGSSLLWSTFLGGNLWDTAHALAIDASGAVTVAGLTISFDFPTTPWAYDTSYNDVGFFSGDAFISRFDATGSSLLWSTFLGGGNQDHASALALDASGAVTVAGWTTTFYFPTTPGAYDPTHNHNSSSGGSVISDAFVSRLEPNILPPCPAGACLDLLGTPAIGNSVAIWLQSPTVNAPCYVLADTQTGAVPLGTYGFTQIALSPNVVPLADPSGTFGTSITGPNTDSDANWNFTTTLPNDPAIIGSTFYIEAYVMDTAAPNGLFWQSNLLTVTIL